MPRIPPIRRPRSDEEWGPAECSLTVKISKSCRDALKRAAIRKETEVQAILADPTKKYGVHALARAVLERTARIELIDNGPLGGAA
jgi:hypothetical protein